MAGKQYTFPLLMRSTISGLLVMMESANGNDGTGKVVGKGHGGSNASRSYSLGEQLDDWNMGIFIPFTPMLIKTDKG